ncbi:hypothetical protein RXV86_18870 [Alisedimentitalea sp. MJ-SS2]|uniref:hypothetical protein n=1 Tax=Aliisedimentitalea sp. MJ-SS2 TaxID=3049795 RepID=UPI00290955C8|nr:hypothetical protein [Alisedimentitalea sp. MJ-SS2]MDU8929456.1 hypothetical protein [Alisedimentitalea sp. MJ-SS2]
MKGVALYFFVTATVAVTLGMIWGIQMSASGDHALGGAHAHLNLVGWVTMALFGVYYHLTPAAAEAMLAKVHYVVALAGLVIMVPGIVQAIRETGETLAKVGSFLTLASMAIFLVTVLMNARRTA